MKAAQSSMVVRDPYQYTECALNQDQLDKFFGLQKSDFKNSVPVR